LNTLQKIFSFLVILFFNGCSVFHYYYISLEEVPDIQVLQYGKYYRELENHESMPIYYKLVRDKYILYFNVDTEYPVPVIIIRARTYNAIDLVIEGINDGCGKFSLQKLSYPKPPQPTRYTWEERPKKSCSFDDPDKQIMKIKVLDQKGNLLGQEKLRFSLVKNGTKVSVDAI
jgi:hypothetical protein